MQHFGLLMLIKVDLISVSEFVEFFSHVNLKGEDSAIQAHRWFYAMNTNKDAKIDLDEYTAFFIKKLDEDGVKETLLILEILEDLIPRVTRSETYSKLSNLTLAEENSTGKVGVALVALTEAQEKMKEETTAEVGFLSAVGDAAGALNRAQHEMKDDSKPEEVDATVHLALDSLAEAKVKLEEEAKLEVAVESALEDAVEALNEVRHEMKGEAKLDQVMESAALRAVDEAQTAIKVTKHKIAEEARMEEELQTAIEATKNVVAETRHASSEAKVDQALEAAVTATNKALLDAKTERQAGSFTERGIEKASSFIKNAEEQTAD